MNDQRIYLGIRKEKKKNIAACGKRSETDDARVRVVGFPAVTKKELAV